MKMNDNSPITLILLALLGLPILFFVVLALLGAGVEVMVWMNGAM